MHELAVDPGGHHPGRADLVGRPRERVAVEHHEVGGRSRLEDARAVEEVAAYTSGSAWANGRDDAGRIEEGAVADLVVLDRDPFAGPTEEIGAAQVVSTWVDGALVHD